MDMPGLFASLGIDPAHYRGGDLLARSPIDGAELAQLASHTKPQVTALVDEAQSAFEQWRNWPAPRRGEVVRLFGEELRAAKEPLARLVTLEAGKILEEG